MKLAVLIQDSVRNDIRRLLIYGIVLKRNMPKYYEERPEKENKRACDGVREDLKTCLLESDCVRLHKKTPKQCLLIKDSSVPDECQQLKMAFFDCKRSLLDNRQRFRGHKGY